MTDPFDALRAGDVAVAPGAEFASTLRARLERALALPRGVTMTATSTATPAPVVTGAAVPYLAVRDARAAIEWYVDVLGARLEQDPIVMPDGRVGHAELHFEAGVIYLADEHPEIGVVAPRPDAAAVSLMLPVDDADAVRARALAAGASGDREPYDAYGSRNAWIVDPFAHRWGLHSPLAQPSAGVAYVSLWVPEAARARRFWNAALGWMFAGDQVVGARPSAGVHETTGDPALLCCFAVPDLDAAVERVRAAGGTAGPPDVRGYGRVADCLDDQGVPFALSEGDSPDADDIAYLTLEVVDADKARAFYGAVLGWTFRAGSVPDGWQVENSVPMAGLSGGHAVAAAVPMWRVDDVHAAVARVRAAGGTATEPQRQRYGITSECTDDQGSRFYLGSVQRARPEQRGQ